MKIFHARCFPNYGIIDGSDQRIHTYIKTRKTWTRELMPPVRYRDQPSSADDEEGSDVMMLNRLLST